MPTPDPTNLLPLREPTFFILLSLMPEAKYGYAILKDVESLSQGKVRLSTGTLYEALVRLHDQGLIERVDNNEEGGKEEMADHPGKPRKSYRLTSFGRLVIAREVERLETLVRAARQRMEGEWARGSGS